MVSKAKLVSAYNLITNKTLAIPEKLSFSTFINMILAVENRHWQPFHDVCKYCVVQYDFIGRMERFDEDIQYVAERNNFTHILNTGKTYHLNAAKVHKKVKRTGTLDRNKKVTHYFSQLSKDLLSRVRRHYQIDFEMFGYDPNQYLKQ